jgi:hypothetical protein
MAYSAKWFAGVTSGDQAKQKRSVSVRVSEADAQAFAAAADHTARMATDAGLLLLSLNDAQASDGGNTIFAFYLTMQDVNDAYAPPPSISNPKIFNSNSIKLTYRTTNGGFPVDESIYITQRGDGLPMNPDGKSYNILASPFVNMTTQLLATGLSSYGTAITALVEAIPNDI